MPNHQRYSGSVLSENNHIINPLPQNCFRNCSHSGQVWARFDKTGLTTFESVKTHSQQLSLPNCFSSFWFKLCQYKWTKSFWGVTSDLWTRDKQEQKLGTEGLLFKSIKITKAEQVNKPWCTNYTWINSIWNETHIPGQEVMKTWKRQI